MKEDVGIELHDEREDRHSSDLLEHLHLDREQHPREPLLEGDWA